MSFVATTETDGNHVSVKVEVHDVSEAPVRAHVRDAGKLPRGPDRRLPIGDAVLQQAVRPSVPGET
jgi:hypothetical protein